MSCYFSIHPEQCKHSVVLWMGYWVSLHRWLYRNVCCFPLSRLNPPPALHCSLPGLHGGEDCRVTGRYLWDHETNPGSQSHPQHLQDDWISSAGHLWLSQVWTVGGGQNVCHIQHICIKLFLRVALTKKGVRFGHPLGTMNEC